MNAGRITARVGNDHEARYSAIGLHQEPAAHVPLKYPALRWIAHLCELLACLVGIAGFTAAAATLIYSVFFGPASSRGEELRFVGFLLAGRLGWAWLRAVSKRIFMMLDIEESTTRAARR